jgi:hypothetical protein
MIINPPPTGNEVMPDLAESIFTFLAGVPMIIVLGLALHQAIRRRDPLLLYCFIGGGLASFFEPVADLLSGLYFPAVNQNTAFETFDRPIPWALVFAYPWYVGGQGYLTYRILQSGTTAGRIWQLWFLFIVSDILLESPGVLTGFHTYYGNQPFNYWGFPLWMAAYQSVMPLAAGALVYAARRHCTNNWQLLVVIPFIPMADGMVNAGLALPVWTTLGSGMSLFANHLAAVTTMGLSALSVWLLIWIFATTRPTP